MSAATVQSFFFTFIRFLYIHPFLHSAGYIYTLGSIFQLKNMKRRARKSHRDAAKHAFETLSREHPCYSESAHGKFGRIHIPAAKKCNIACGFCERRVSEYYHTSRPGVAGRLVKPDDAVSYVEKALKDEPMTRIVGIAGPGDPLFNKETFETLRLVHKKFPRLGLCICTNGFLLPEKLGDLLRAGVSSITVTVNAVDPEIGARINAAIRYHGKTIRGVRAAEILLKNQLLGIRMAVKKGILVKVNTVLIPDINLFHVKDIARKLSTLKVPIMNIMPLIPCGKFRSLRRPTCDELIEARETAEKFIPQFRACRQCRADACGVPGEDDLKKGMPGKNKIELPKNYS
jgi:nitrogen fixation protein NifB